jgi:isopentenyldiphosphate isomerase
MSTISTDELFDVFDETNTILLGTVPRNEVHASGQYHRAVNVLLFNSDNQILLQKRMPTKDVSPNAWDLSVRLFNILFVVNLNQCSN